MPGIELKKDPYLLAFAGLLIVCATVLVWHGDVSLREAGGFLTGALAMPGLFGKKDAS